MSCQQVPTTPAFNPYPRSVQVGEFEVAIGGGIWVAIRASALVLPAPVVQALDTLFAPGRAQGERYPDAGWAGVETR